MASVAASASAVPPPVTFAECAAAGVKRLVHVSAVSAEAASAASPSRTCAARNSAESATRELDAAGLPVHVDGARLWNAAAALGVLVTAALVVRLVSRVARAATCGACCGRASPTASRLSLPGCR